MNTCKWLVLINNISLLEGTHVATQMSGPHLIESKIEVENRSKTEGERH